MSRIPNPRINVSISPAQLARLQDALDPKQYRQATFRVVQEGNKAVAKAVKKEVKARSHIQAKYVNRVVVTIPPKGDPPVGFVKISKETLPLVAFPHKAPPKRKKQPPPPPGKKRRKRKPPKRVGVTVQMTKGRPPLHLRHAFKATVGKGGHAGIFLRAKGRTKHGKLTPSGFAGRLPIEEQLGRSVYGVVNVPEVLDSVVVDAAAVMDKHTQSQLDRFLKKKKK